MKAVVQRVSEAHVAVDGDVVGRIGLGLLVLLGVAAGDTPSDAASLARKVCALRIFGDSNGKMNLSVTDVEGGVLVVSQFTLLADVQRGRRPSFVGAAAPEAAAALYEKFADEVEALGVPVQKGVFGAHMRVSLVNDGPVTIIYDSVRSPSAQP